MNTKELFAALEMLEKEKGIPMDYMIENIEKGIEVACKNYYGGNDEVVFKILPDRNVFDVRLMKTVVEEVFDPDYEISLEDAQKVLKRKAINIDDKVAIPLDPKDLGRIAIGAASKNDEKRAEKIKSPSWASRGQCCPQAQNVTGCLFCEI